MIKERILIIGVIFFVIVFGVLLLVFDGIKGNRQVSLSVLLMITFIVTSVITFLFMTTINMYRW